MPSKWDLTVNKLWETYQEMEALKRKPDGDFVDAKKALELMEQMYKTLKDYAIQFSPRKGSSKGRRKKCSDLDIADIIRMSMAGISNCKIADLYGISESTVRLYTGKKTAANSKAK